VRRQDAALDEAGMKMKKNDGMNRIDGIKAEGSVFNLKAGMEVLRELFYPVHPVYPCKMIFVFL
jgi:hypothetical protein